MDLPRESIGLGTRPALVLVDLSNGFTSPDSPLGGDFADVLAAAARLLAAFRIAALPVCFTTVVYRSAREARVFRRRLPALNLLQADTHWVEIDARVAPRRGEPVVEKRWASGFFGTGLAAWLEEQRADSLVVVGLTTSGCVRATAVDGLQRDYPVVVVSDAVGDRNADAHRANLHDLHAKYADVLDADAVIGHLHRLAASEEVANG